MVDWLYLGRIIVGEAVAPREFHFESALEDSFFCGQAVKKRYLVSKQLSSFHYDRLSHHSQIKTLEIMVQKRYSSLGIGFTE